MNSTLETVTLGDLVVTIDDETRTLTSWWPDGTTLDAKPNYDEESVARAKALGYPGFSEGVKGTVWQMTRDHDLFHHLVAQAEGYPWSWHLRNVAVGAYPGSDDYVITDGDREERLVFLLQRAVNVGRDGLMNAR